MGNDAAVHSFDVTENRLNYVTDSIRTVIVTRRRGLEWAHVIVIDHTQRMNYHVSRTMRGLTSLT